MTTTAATTRAPATARVGARENALAGTGALIRFIFRRDRIRTPIWIGVLALVTIWSASTLPDFYQTEADRQSRADLMSNPAALAFAGPGHGLDDYTFGAMMAQEMLGFVAIFVAIMTVLMVVRHTRTEEETGRTELVRASIVGRHAHMAAALIVAAAVCIALGAVMAVGLAALGIESIDWVGSIAFGAALAVIGLVFAGVAAVTVQVTEHARGASGVAFGVLGATYALRGIGDMGNGALSWLSPFGWAQASRAYVDERWWPLGLAVVVAVALAAVAFYLSTQRDVGAGLRAPRAGSPGASDVLSHPLGLALRLHRGSLIGWSIGMFLFGALYGSLAGEIESFVSDNPTLREWVEQVEGASIIESWMAVVVSLLATICGIYAILAAQRLRGEETAGRAEPLLATALSRARWYASHLTVALVGGAALILVSGLGLGLSASMAADDWNLLPKIMGASLAYVPAIWLTGGLTAALFGLFPRATAAAWLVVAYALTLGMLGGFIPFPGWMDNFSPFGLTPLLPADDLAIAPLAGLMVVAAALVAVGLLAFRRRDLEAV